MSRAAVNTFAELTTLANEVPALKDAFEEAYGSWWSSNEVAEEPCSRRSDSWGDVAAEIHGAASEASYSADADLPDGDSWPEERDQIGPQDGAELWDDQLWFDSDEAAQAAHDADLGHCRRDDFVPLTIDHARRVKSLGKRLQRLNNALSLVIAADDRSVLNFGDAEGWGLAGAVSYHHNRFGRCVYDLILAPHHGTARTDLATEDLFPFANLLVAQNGRRHEGNFNPFYARRAVRTHFAYCGPITMDHWFGTIR